jgi:hypothetical protein
MNIIRILGFAHTVQSNTQWRFSRWKRHSLREALKLLKMFECKTKRVNSKMKMFSQQLWELTEAALSVNKLNSF